MPVQIDESGARFISAAVNQFVAHGGVAYAVSIGDVLERLARRVEAAIAVALEHAVLEPAAHQNAIEAVRRHLDVAVLLTEAEEADRVRMGLDPFPPV